MSPFTLALPSPEATLALGRALGERLLPHDFVALRGALGAGKTQLARGAALGAGVPDGEGVASPTFALVHLYRGRVPVQHVDLYRLGSEAELFALGWDDLLAEPAATLCEWPERAGALLPPDRLELALARSGPESRSLRVEALGARAEVLAQALHEADLT